MPKNDGESTIDFLIRRRFGRLEIVTLQFIAKLREKRSPHADMYDVQDRPVRTFRAELSKKSTEELAALETEEIQKEERELFGAKADFDHWSKMADWTLDQAIALSFGRAPEIVNWRTVSPHIGWSRFAFEYSRVRDRALSYVRWEQLYDPVLPTLFLAWARRDGFPVEPELIRRVEARGLVIADWKDLFEKAKRERDELAAALAAANTQIQQMVGKIEKVAAQNPNVSAVDEQTLSPGERKTLLKLGAYLGRRFEYDPTSNRSDAIGKIRNELERVGISLDVKTVRNLVRTGSERYRQGESDS